MKMAVDNIVPTNEKTNQNIFVVEEPGGLSQITMSRAPKYGDTWSAKLGRYC